MALDFPNSPSLNDTVALGGKTYQWDGVKWRMVYVITPTASATAPSITVVSTSPTGVTFTLTNNDNNTAIISYDISTVQGAVELAASATSSNITVDLAAGTYTLTAFATVVGEVATSATASVEITVPQYKLLYDSETANNGNPISLPTTQIDITGLNITKDDGLRLVYTFVGDTNTASAVYGIFPNDIFTESFYTQMLEGTNTSLQASRQTTLPYSNWLAWARNLTDGRRSAGFADIKISNNDRFVYQSQFMRYIGSPLAGGAGDFGQFNSNVICTSTVSSITKLSIKSDRTNGIATGSRIQLYKVTEAA